MDATATKKDRRANRPVKTKGRASRPNKRQCAMLIVHLLATKQQEVPGNREVTRARLSEITLQRLFMRRRISPELLAEVQEWLFRVGLVLFFAGTTYAVVKTKVIDGWGRISSKRIGKDLEKVGRGEFDYNTLEHLLLGPDVSVERED
jgi:hypothetical protein